MTQPKFAPISTQDEVRSAYRLAPPRPWTPHRPGEHSKTGDAGKGRGAPGPDQGYALGLAERLRDRLVLAPGEHADDALCAGIVLGLSRASSFGRAPVLGDIELGLDLLGFLGAAPSDLVEYRRGLVDGIGHDYSRQRTLAEQVPIATLRSSRADASAAGWRVGLGLGEPAPA